MMPANKGNALLLSGLDGSNPLAFLAAVGTLRVATEFEQENDWRLTWKLRNGAWTPLLFGGKCGASKLITSLRQALNGESAPEFEFAKNLNISPEEFRRVAEQAQGESSRTTRRYADFISSFGCEVITTSDGKCIEDTALRTMSGAGHQHFLGTMKKLAEQTQNHHLRRALFESWDYADEKLGLRWDPEEDRRYALRWKAPSSDTIRTMWGANRLAVEALPLFPTAPFGRRLDTVGFATRARLVFFSWPIWNGNLSLNVMRSLLTSPEITREVPNRALLKAKGVVEIYRSQRVTVGKYRNFQHAKPA